MKPSPIQKHYLEGILYRAVEDFLWGTFYITIIIIEELVRWSSRNMWIFYIILHERIAIGIIASGRKSDHGISAVVD
jgi:hypothetical protein